jgi:hypothetical protein
MSLKAVQYVFHPSKVAVQKIGPVVNSLSLIRLSDIGCPNEHAELDLCSRITKKKQVKHKDLVIWRNKVTLLALLIQRCPKWKCLTRTKAPNIFYQMKDTKRPSSNKTIDKCKARISTLVFSTHEKYLDMIDLLFSIFASWNMRNLWNDQPSKPICFWSFGAYYKR